MGGEVLDANRFAVDEPGRKSQGLSDAPGPVLIAVAEPVDAELMAIAQQAQGPQPAGSYGMMIGLGPGVSVELILLQW